MKKIDEQRLEEDLGYRFEYARDFLDFDEDDVAAIRALIANLGPRVDAIVERTYEKLLAFDATARHFVVRGTGFEGPLPAGAEELSTENEQIKFRKTHLRSYLLNLLGRPYDGSMATYLDTVAKMHTPTAGNSRINVPQSQMNIFLGMLSVLLIDEISALELDRDKAIRAIRAFTKVMWIQNDFVNRHY